MREKLANEGKELYDIKQERSLLDEVASSGLTLVGPKKKSARLEKSISNQASKARCLKSAPRSQFECLSLSIAAS